MNELLLEIYNLKRTLTVAMNPKDAKSVIISRFQRQPWSSLDMISIAQDELDDVIKALRKAKKAMDNE